MSRDTSQKYLSRFAPGLEPKLSIFYLLTDMGFLKFHSHFVQFVILAGNALGKSLGNLIKVVQVLNGSLTCHAVLHFLSKANYGP
jgi:hypothetical protein